MTTGSIKDAFFRLSNDIKTHINSAEYRNMIAEAEKNNPWFEKNMTTAAILNLCCLLDTIDEDYTVKNLPIREKPLHIMIVCAGNIPAVAFHDIMCVLLAGGKAYIKLSSSDNIIIPFLLNRLTSFLEELKSNIEYIQTPLSALQCRIDGVTATGSNSSSLVFEQYFRNIPHVIRKSRYSAAIIKADDDISGIEDDICLFFGQGCRSISHLFVPEGYDFAVLVQKLQKYSCFTDHNKYRNNLDYQKAVMIMNNIDFIDANAVLLRENAELFSPVGVVNYSYYDDINSVYAILDAQKDNLQCLTSCDAAISAVKVPSQCAFGANQRPVFTDYADGVNILQWLQSL